MQGLCKLLPYPAECPGNSPCAVGHAVQIALSTEPTCPVDADLLQAAAALLPDALEQDPAGTGALLAAAPLAALAPGGQLHETAAGEPVSSKITVTPGGSVQMGTVGCRPARCAAPGGQLHAIA